jgi:hypothetical protein
MRNQKLLETEEREAIQGMAIPESRNPKPAGDRSEGSRRPSFLIHIKCDVSCSGNLTRTRVYGQIGYFPMSGLPKRAIDSLGVGPTTLWNSLGILQLAVCDPNGRKGPTNPDT